MEDIFDTISRMYGELDDDTECDSTSGKDKPDLSNVSDGEEFEFRGIRFIRLGFEQDGILCITKDSMFRSKFNNDDNNNYKDSIVRQKILNEFLPIFEGVDLLPYEMNLMACNGETDYGSCIDYAGLLTMDLYRKYRYQIPISDGDQWLCTPFACMDRWPYVQFVNSSGSVSGHYGAYNAFRCRPACIFAI